MAHIGFAVVAVSHVYTSVTFSRQSKTYWMEIHPLYVNTYSILEFIQKTLAQFLGFKYGSENS